MKIARLCKEFNCLPYEGGLLQQPKGAIIKLDAVLRASDSFEKTQSNKAEAIAKRDGRKD